MLDKTFEFQEMGQFLAFEIKFNTDLGYYTTKDQKLELEELKNKLET